jgi:hypothetical protein
MKEEVLMSPVAEYKGIAIIEVKGSIRAFWRGKEYFTDGKSYLMHSGDEPHSVAILGFPNEYVIKQFIDERHAKDLAKFYSYAQAYEAICKEKPTVIPTYHWDETQMVFIAD